MTDEYDDAEAGVEEYEFFAKGIRKKPSTTMTDEQLCDALVEAGLLKYSGTSGPQGLGYEVPGALFEKYATEAITDWRVAGACLERMGGIYAHCEPHIKGWHVYLETDGSVRLPVDHATAQSGESLPRAIITAFVESRK